MQPGHYIANDFTDPRLLLVSRFFIRATQRHKTLGAFQLFSVEKWHAKLSGNALGDGITGNRNRARVDTAFFQKQQIGRACANVHHHRAAVNFAFVVAHGVDQRHWRHIDDFSAQPGGFDTLVQLFNDVALDCQQNDFKLTLLRAAQQLMIPDDLINWERHVLLRFVLNDLFDFRFFHRRQFDKPGEHRLPGDAKHHMAGLDVFFTERVADRGNDERLAILLVLRIQSEIRVVEINQPQPMRLRHLKFANLNGRSADVDSEDFVSGKHRD